MNGKINWKPSNKDLASFGLVLLIGFGVIGTIVFFKGKPALAMGLWFGAAFLSVLSIVLPSAAKPFYFIWMGLGLVIGAVMSRIVLAIIYFVVITPVALFFRLKGRDALNRKRKTGASTYWSDHPVIDDKSYYKHLF